MMKFTHIAFALASFSTSLALADLSTGGVAEKTSDCGGLSCKGYCCNDYCSGSPCQDGSGGYFNSTSSGFKNSIPVLGGVLVAGALIL